MQFCWRGGGDWAVLGRGLDQKDLHAGPQGDRIKQHKPPITTQNP